MPELIISRVCWSGSTGYLAAREAGENISVVAGGLRSGRGQFGAPLSYDDLMRQFGKHCRLWTKQPPQFCLNRATALVSGSDRIIDTLWRGLHLCHSMMEQPEHVHIIFIHIPENRRGEVHSAMELAKRSGTSDARKYKHEFLFEWCIPTEFVTHFVTVKTLMDRGLDRKLVPFSPNTRTLRYAMRDRIFRGAGCGWDVGLSLGHVAKHFGANSPCTWVAERLMLDLVDAVNDSDDGQVCYSDRTTETLSSDFLEAVKDGINTYLVDWWLLSADFENVIQDYKLWCEIHEDMVLQAAEYLHDGLKPGVTSQVAQLAYTAKVKRIEESVTIEGIRIGL